MLADHVHDHPARSTAGQGAGGMALSLAPGAFPPPPPFYRLYAVGGPNPPPPPPLLGEFRVFGRDFSVVRQGM